MNRSQAIEIYLKTQTHAESQIKRLMEWNPKLSIPQNARRLGIHGDSIRTWAHKCGLKYKAIPSGSYKGKIKDEKFNKSAASI